MIARDITAARLLSEEGKRRVPYNDATGITVTCKPHGNLTIGVGINLEVGLDDYEIAILLQHRLEICESSLIQQLNWYQSTDEVRKSVFLDVAFNGGVSGLIHGYPRCLAYAAARDWTNCARELTVADARLDQSRYAPLRIILSSGNLHA